MRWKELGVYENQKAPGTRVWMLRGWHLQGWHWGAAATPYRGWGLLSDPVAGTLLLPRVVRGGVQLLPPSSVSTAKGSKPSGPCQVAGGFWGSQCEEGALWRVVKEKPGFTGGRRAACAKAQRCGKAEFGV